MSMSAESREHYESTMESVPGPIDAMFKMDGQFADAYTEIRQGIYQERSEGFDLATKELFLVVLDITVHNRDGALNHLAAARRAGATADQVKEMLMMAFLVIGVSGWGLVGCHVWEAIEGEES
jgi:alkylhydroperoxidase/carboxymuconolactone decarboxylase family protein YurZ